MVPTYKLTMGQEFSKHLTVNPIKETSVIQYATVLRFPANCHYFYSDSEL